jgi:DNA-binding NarL/FixJ family response regulator
MAIKILLVDDHPILREGMRSLLERQPDMEVVGEAGDGAAALRLVEQLDPDLILLDVNMPGMDGIDVTRRLRQDHPRVKVLALSMHLRKTFVSEMLLSGAAGYILKDSTFAEVLDAIRTVLRGQRYVTGRVASLLVDNYVERGAGDVRSAQLAPRELQVVRLLAGGKSSKEIALTTETSVKTVDACRRRAMQKLGVRSVADLVKYAIREGLTTVDC